MGLDTTTIAGCRSTHIQSRGHRRRISPARRSVLREDHRGMSARRAVVAWSCTTGSRISSRREHSAIRTMCRRIRVSRRPRRGDHEPSLGTALRGTPDVSCLNTRGIPSVQSARFAASSDMSLGTPVATITRGAEGDGGIDYPRSDSSSRPAHRWFVEPVTALDELAVGRLRRTRTAAAARRSSAQEIPRSFGGTETRRFIQSEVFADRTPRGGRAVPRTQTPSTMMPD